MSTKATKQQNQQFNWWRAKSKLAMKDQLLGTATYLKDTQNYRYRQAAVFARLYGNQSLFNFIGSNMAKMDNQTGLPLDRPTFNLIQSSIDTLVSKIGQSKPSPVFLTDGSDYRERSRAKKLNHFTQGEFYQTKAYQKGVIALRDALIEGTGCLKVYQTADDKVGIDRVLFTELFIDPNEAIYGEPRQLYQVKLVDRHVLKEVPGFDTSGLDIAETATVDNSADSTKTVSDMVLVVEGWHLPSGPGAKDGMHVIATSSGILFEEPYTKDRFPFVFLHFSPRMLGFWAQGLSEQLMGTQLEINSLLFQISRSIKLVGVPRVFVEMGSKVNKAAFNNEVGTIIEFQGTKPQYETADCVPQELYAQLQRTIDYGFQQAGVSMLQATSQKPAGLDSGEAIRTYDDISNDRFQTLAKRYDDMYIDLAYLVIDTASDIAKRTKEYQTVYPGKNGVQMIDLPEIDMEEDPFIIQCFNMSSLPRDPAGRMAKVTEMIQSGMISIKEGRRLLDYPDLEQVERLANAAEERVYKYLDDIIEEADYHGPDQFMDLQFAMETAVAYYNLYVPANLEPEKEQMIQDFYTQCLMIGQAGAPPQAAPNAPGAQPGPNPPQAAPMPQAQSPLVPNTAQPGATQ